MILVILYIPKLLGSSTLAIIISFNSNASIKSALVSVVLPYVYTLIRIVLVLAVSRFIILGESKWPEDWPTEVLYRYVNCDAEPSAYFYLKNLDISARQ